MNSSENITIANSVVRNKMVRGFWSRFNGKAVYKQSRKRISEDEVRALQTELLSRGIYSEAEYSTDNYYLRVTESATPKKRSGWTTHIVLLLLTIITTTITGSELGMRNPFESWANFSYGFYYSFALLTILFCHEMGHYLYARYYKIEVTPPYFIPFYFPVFHPGTLGAFIKLKSPIPDKKALFDVGIAGPLAGFVVSVAFIFAGLVTLPDEQSMWAFISTLHPLSGGENVVALTMGRNLLWDFLVMITGRQYLPMTEMYHFPFVFAGWFGLLVTAINLMPIGQLDGGHITYALFGKRSGKIAVGVFSMLIVLNIYLYFRYNSLSYLLWMILILLLIRFRHPPTLNDEVQLDTKRKILGYLSYIIFAVCFPPLPIYIS